MEFTPIAELGPSLAAAESRHIRAIVTIMWPYSSSTKTVALLLVEPDFRLRNKRGQVRVQFRGASAVEVARAGVASGDEVILGLRGARWVEATPGISTPGKSVDAELVYGRRLALKVSRAGQEIAQLDVDDVSVSEPASRSQSPPSPVDGLHAFATPALARVNGHSTPASSAFHRKARVSSGPLVDSPYDPFVSERRGNGEPERKRMRRSWGNEGRWKLENQLPSPTKDLRESRWLEEGEEESPEPPGSPIARLEPHAARLLESASFTTSVEPEATSSQIEEMKTQYTQELVDLVSGDTEEDTDMEEPRSSSPVGESVGAAQGEGEQPTWGRSKFAVFRDVTTVQEEIEQPSDDPIELHDARVSNLESLGVEQDEIFEFSPVNHEKQTGTTGHETGDLASNLPEVQGFGSFIDSASSEAQAVLPDMPPPNLTAIQTSNFGFSFGQPSNLAPLPARPTSPRTPDIRPQHSATLPLPSPFPGDNLATSYIDAFPTPQLPGDLFGNSRTGTPTLAPDHLFQFGFTFGSTGLAQEGFVPDVSTMGELTGPLLSSLPTESNQAQIEGDVLYPNLEMPAPSAFELQHTGEGPQREEIPWLYPNLTTQNLEEGGLDFAPSVEPAPGSVYDDFVEKEQGEEREFNHQARAASEAMDNQDHASMRQTSMASKSASGIGEGEEEHAPPKSSAPMVIDLTAESSDSRSSESEEDIDDAGDDDQMVRDGFHDRRHALEGTESSEEEQSQEDSQQSNEEDDFDEGEDDDEDDDDEMESGSEAPESYDSDKDEPRFEPRSTHDTQPSPKPSQGIPQYDGTGAAPPGLLVTAPVATPSGPLPLKSAPTTVSHREPVVIDLGSESESEGVSESEDEDEDEDVAVSPKAREIAESRLDPKSDDNMSDADNDGEQQAGKEGEIPSTLPHPAMDVSRLPSSAPEGSTEASLYPALSTLVDGQGRSEPVVQSDSATAAQQSLAESNLPITPQHSQHSFSQSVLPAAQQHSALPPTPQMTQGTAIPSFTSVTREEEEFGRRVAEMEDVESPAAPATMPKEDATREANGDGKTLDSQFPKEFSFSQSQQTQSKGLLTRLSYYTPVARLVAHLNVSSSQSYSDAGLDLLAVVSKPTTVPQRAEKGQRDYYTTFSITDSTFWPCNVRVQVFRPWKAALPKAAKGDVVLLRGFDVFSAKGPIGFALRSGEGAAWCVWRWGDELHAHGRAAHNGAEKTLREREEIRGPPVEIGEEERAHADALSAWWAEQAEVSSLGNAKGSVTVEEIGEMAAQ